jgi:hypothetical protein
MRKKLGEILIASGAVTQADLDLALGDQTAGEPARLGDLLVSLGRITPTQLAKALSQQHAIPFIQLPPVPPDVLRAVPIEFQQAHRFVPFRVTGDAISIAMADPSNADAIEELRSSLNKRVNKYVAAGDEIDAVHATVAPPSVELPSIAPTVAPVGHSPTADELFGSLDEASAPAPTSGLGDDLFSGLDLPPTTADVPPPPAVQPVAEPSFELDQVPDVQVVVESRDEEEPEFFESKPVVPAVHAPAPPSIPPSPAPFGQEPEEILLEPADQGLTSSPSGTFSVTTFELDDPPQAPSGVMLTESQAVFPESAPAMESSGSFELSVDPPPAASSASFEVSVDPPAATSASFEVSLSESAVASLPNESSGSFEVSVAESSGSFASAAAPLAPSGSADDFFAQTAPPPAGAFGTQEEVLSLEELPEASSDSQPQAAAADALFGPAAAMTDELFSDVEPQPAAGGDFPFAPPPEPAMPAVAAHAPAPEPLALPEDAGPPLPETVDEAPASAGPRESLPSWLGTAPAAPEPVPEPEPAPEPQLSPAPVLQPGEWTGKLDDVPPSRLIVGAVKALVLKGFLSEAEILEAIAKKS